MTVSHMHDEQMIQECLDGQSDRDCTYCSAHNSNGGLCCFGVYYESPDEKCDSCPIQSACGPATYSYSSRSTKTRIPIRPRRTATPSSRLPTYGKNKGGLLGIEDSPSIPLQKSQEGEIVQTQECTGKVKAFFKQIGLHAVWGAGEGSLEMMLGFMRRRRPE